MSRKWFPEKGGQGGAVSYQDGLPSWVSFSILETFFSSDVVSFVHVILSQRMHYIQEGIDTETLANMH